ncbi:nucleotidyltransferase domain-containing protein [Acetobacter papayae]|uniref:nucleotidyltransferase domain-containing protein n=1 Tax=Acetobacter papayae TaxID=1076592 RepID=UPI000471BA82|nr:nucleotidyltransferase domain-containing protein [Acetobacter papayae]
MISTYDKTTEASDTALERLRESLKSIIPPEAIALTCGSYARREATVGSDLDFYVLVPALDDSSEPEWFTRAKDAITEVVTKPPSAGGAFESLIQIHDLLNNFGGDKDTNQTITRRMLYLLEGEYLTNETEFKRIRRNIIERYVSETRDDRHIAQYLLNDIIRYWRTITVDYAFKTQEVGKPWAIRNIKLVFSRKLIYASGLFSVAMTHNRNQEEKIETLESLFSIPPLKRIEYICGKANTQELVTSYNRFLSQIDNKEMRSHLETISKENRDTDQKFRELKDEGYRFGTELLAAFNNTFPADHPIHRAVIF